MVIATFGPSTAWVGKAITFENGRFVLEGKGPIAAVNVLAYDREGHLSWAYAGLREWVEQVAAGGVVPEPVSAGVPVAATALVARPVAVAQPVPGKKRFPVWAIVLIAVAAVAALLILLFAVFLLPVRSTSTSGSDSAVLTSGSATVSAQESGSTEDLLGVAFGDGDHGWAVSADGAILATANGGATWSAQSSGSSADLRAVAFSDAAHGWAVGADGAILAITD
ncbi:MAG: YCF48-related protein [Actinomycetes bacterium]